MATEYVLQEGKTYFVRGCCINSNYLEDATRYPSMTEAELDRLKYGLADYSVVPVEERTGSG